MYLLQDMAVYNIIKKKKTSPFIATSIQGKSLSFR